VLERPFFLGWRRASEKKADAYKVNERLFRAGEPFIVFTQPPMSPQPGKRPLHHPTSGNDVEPCLVAQIREPVRGIALELPIGRIDDA